MIQEDRKLLLKDISARLTYGVQCQFSYHNIHRLKEGIVIEDDCEQMEGMIIGLYNNTSFYIYSKEVHDMEFCPRIEDCRPYLRPMSSMTDKERGEYDTYRKHVCDEYNRYCFDSMESIDWLNQHYFDYRGLIEKGLALEAPDGMYKI